MTDKEPMTPEERLRWADVLDGWKEEVAKTAEDKVREGQTP